MKKIKKQLIFKELSVLMFLQEQKAQILYVVSA